MPIVAPPPHDDPELLIREARARQRKRRLGVVVVVALLAGGATVAYSIAGGVRSGSTQPDTSRATVKGTKPCGVRVRRTRIFQGGRVVYRDPSPAAMSDTVRCSGPSVWVVFVNGVGMMHEEYVGVRSGDGGRTWRVVFAQQPGVRSHGLDAEVGPWTLDGPRSAYFVGTCPACRGVGALSLSITRDAGQTFRRYRVPGNDLWTPRSIRVRGRQVTIRERRDIWHHQGWRTVTLRVA
jgi:hypothetical protein